MRTLLIDADIIAYRAASAIETPIDWGDDLWTLHSDLNEAKRVVDDHIERLKQATESDKVIICLTDVDNFRTRIYPAYKSNRDKIRKPLVLKATKDYLAETYDSYIRPGLEADDIMGILQTSDKIVKGETVVCTVDKDLKTVPGLFAHMDKPKMITQISEAEADYNHLFQTLVGDPTDGFPGCRNVGPKTAHKILEPFMVQGEFPVRDAWVEVVGAFDKHRFSEEEALVMARVARILRVKDYDFKKKEVILWEPK